ncbi:MAG: hypothetical protein HQL64_10225 [Magnetococcales bacterium]|nr:hypothetical protein [Magnetococcales bacterium]
MNKTRFLSLSTMTLAAATLTGVMSFSTAACAQAPRSELYAQGSEREKNWEWYGDNYVRHPQEQKRPESQTYPERRQSSRDAPRAPDRSPKERPWGEVPRGYQPDSPHNLPYGQPPGWEPPSRDGYAPPPYPRGNAHDEYRRETPPPGGYYAPDRDAAYGDERPGRYGDERRGRYDEREWSPSSPGRGYDDRFGPGYGRYDSSPWGYGGNYGRNPNGESYPEYPGNELGLGGPGGWGDPFRWGRW